MTTPIFTGSWRSTSDPDLYCRIGISRSTPRNERGFRCYPRLNPGRWWRDILDPVEWARRYQSDILEPLDAAKVVEELQAMAGHRSPLLLCWERADDEAEWCHRGLVAAWLFDELGLHVTELGLGGGGCGHAHPKLPASLRRCD